MNALPTLVAASWIALLTPGCAELVEGSRSGTCGMASYVTAYDQAPLLGAGWWYVSEGSPYDDSPMLGADGDPPDQGNADQGSDPGSSGSDPTDGSGDPSGDGTTDDGSDGIGDSSEPQSLLPRATGAPGGRVHAASFAGDTCFSCTLTCSLSGGAPGAPGAISATGASRLSDAAACRDAQQQLTAYASNPLSQSLLACGRGGIR